MPLRLLSTTTRTIRASRGLGPRVDICMPLKPVGRSPQQLSILETSPARTVHVFLRPMHICTYAFLLAFGEHSLNNARDCAKQIVNAPLLTCCSLAPRCMMQGLSRRSNWTCHASMDQNQFSRLQAQEGSRFDHTNAPASRSFPCLEPAARGSRESLMPGDL